MIRKFQLGVVILAILCAGAGLNVQNVQHPLPTDTFIVDTLATGLIVPWSMVFLPDKTMLFSERNGKIRIMRNDQLIAKPVLVVNGIDTTRKMGLLGICQHPAFTKNHYLYISYNYRKDKNFLMRIVRYQFVKDTLVNPAVILDGIYASPNHTGCRLKFGPDGKLYITTGDADRPILAQDLKSLNGKILRVNGDGSIPEDNPFAQNDTARKEIWTYGHRNSQGIDFQPGTGYLFNSEHGPTGGDEINVIKKGFNYGWPVIHHRDVKDGMISPLMEYSPSIGPSEALFYTADAFPFMKGNLLVACLRGESILRFQLEKDKIISQENLLHQQYGRIRALAIGPDGYIYFSTSQNDPPEGQPKPGYDMILRLRPFSDKKVKQYGETIKNVPQSKTGTTRKSSNVKYMQLCASCHGNSLKGTERATNLLDNKWIYGSARKDIIRNIRQGIIEKGMPAWEGTLTKKEIENLADFILLKVKRK